MIAIINVVKGRVDTNLHNNWEIFQGQFLSVDVGGGEFFIKEFIGDETKVNQKNKPTEKLNKSLKLFHDGLALQIDSTRDTLFILN